MSQKTIAQPNPLMGYFRQPKLYIKLPSKGKFYANDTLTATDNDEYPVFAMTAKDELMFKTPDALMNGQATVSVISSCVPSIKNAWKMPTIDLDVILMAIRVASSGEFMEVVATCPACKHNNEFNLNLVNYISELSDFEFNDSLTVGELVIKIRPFTYKELSDTQIKTMEEQKILSIVNDKEISDTDKLNKFGESFDKLTSLTVDTVTKCIVSISTPNATVTDQAMIGEFIKNSSGEVFNQLHKKITVMKERMELKARDIKCEECNHVWTAPISMDQTNFFGKGS